MITAAVAPLQAQVTTLQNQLAALPQGAAPAVFIHSPNLQGSAKEQLQRIVRATGGTCTGLGTLTGRPMNSDPISSNNVSGISCTGFYFTISGAATASDTAVVQPLQGNLTVWYDGPNCTGNAYVSVAQLNDQSLSAGALANGAVFRAYQNGADDPMNAASYLMLKPGTAVSDPVLMSSLANLQCTAQGGISFDVYQLAANDETVSGVPSAPIPGPVTVQ